MEDSNITLVKGSVIGKQTSLDDDYYEVNSADMNKDDSKKFRTNRFRFQSFTEKIAKLDINIFHKGSGDTVIELEHDNDSYFHQTLCSWKELNLTQHYTNFLTHVRKYHASLPEIIVHKEKIIDILLYHLSIQNSLALKPLLSCLTALTRDLRSEIYSSFLKILKVLMDILKNSMNPSAIEELFTCICFMFKFLEKQIIPNFFEIYQFYSDLFRQKRRFIRRFAAESIAYFLRKIVFEEMDYSLTKLFGQMELNQESDEYIDAFSFFLFHSVKGIKGRYHSRAEHILPLFFKQISINNNNSVNSQSRYQVLVKVFQFLKFHGINQGENLLPIWKTLKSEAELISNDFNSPLTINNNKENMSTRIETFFYIFKDWMKHQHGARVMNISDVFFILGKIMSPDNNGAKSSNNNNTILKTMIQNEFNTHSLLDCLAHSFSIAMHPTYYKDFKEPMMKYLDTLFALEGVKNSHILIFQFCSSVDRIYLQQSTIMNRLTKYLEKNVVKSIDLQESLSFLIRVFTLDENQNPMKVQDYPIIDIPTLSKQVTTILSNYASGKSVANVVDDNNGDKNCTLWTALVASVCLTMPKTITPIVEKTVSMLKKDFDPQSSDDLYLLSQALTSYIMLLSRHDPSKLSSLLPTIVQLLKDHYSQYYILNVASIYFKQLSELNQVQVKQETLPTKGKKTAAPSTSAVNVPCIEYTTFKEILGLFNDNASSKSNAVRKESILVLKGLHECTKGATEEYTEIQRVFNYCYEIETTQLLKAEGRGITAKMDAIGSIYSNGKAPVLNTFIYHYLLGCFYIRYTPLWSAIQKNIVAICKKDVNGFYPIFYKSLESAESSILNLITLKKQKQMDLDVEEEEEDDGVIIDKEEEDENNNEDDTVADEDNQEDAVVNDEDQETTITNLHHIRVRDQLNIIYLYNEILEKINLEENPSVENVSKNILISSTDPINYQAALWKTLTMVGGNVEGQAKNIIIMFMDFVKNDFIKHTKAFKNPAIDFRTIVQERADAKPYSRNQAQTLMVYFLEFFSQFKRPTKMFEEKLIREVFYRCLDVEEPKIQFQALQCYLLWAPSNLISYKKSFERLINDKSMRDEMTTFIISKDSPSASITSDDRPFVVDMVVKILMTKLNRKVGRSPIAAQRSTIFAYISGLDSKELEPIIKKILLPFNPLLDSLSKAKSLNLKNVDLTLLPPMEAQAYFLNILQACIKQLGSLMTPYLSSIMKIVLTIAHNTLVTDIKKSSKVTTSELRSMSFKRCSEIIQQYQAFKDHKIYMKELFNLFSTMLPSLNAHGLPTGMRKCILVVSSIPSMAGFLNQDLTFLPKMLSFIAHKPHQDSFLTVIENLLVNVDETNPDATEETKEIYMAVLLPHIDSIINAVKSVLMRGGNKNNAKSKKVLNPSKLSKRQLAILSEISRFAKSSEQASDVLELLIPFLRYTKLNDDDELVISILVIFKNMLSLIQDAEAHVPTLSSLFGVFKTRATRTALCEIFLVLGEKVSYMKDISIWLDKLNAYTKKSVTLETYDYDKRLEAYSHINDKLLDKINHKQLLPIFVNYVFFIKDHDFSIKNNASAGISKLIKLTGAMIASQPQGQETSADLHERLLLFKNIFEPSMKASFNDKEYRDEYILLFNQLLKDFNGHAMFYPDLMPLLYGDQDEKNFFLNYCHIQKHRKRISFFNLKTIAETHAFNLDTLNQIIIPLSVQAILETTIKDHGSAILGEVVKSFGVIAKKLEWKGYLHILKNLISTMDKHPSRLKFFVKSVCEVIDEFHFFIDEKDVREELLDGSISEKEKNATKDVEMKEQQEEEEDQDDDDEDDDQDQDDDSPLVGVEDHSSIKASTTVTVKRRKVIGEVIVKTKNISEDIFQAITSVLAPSLKKYLVEQRVVSTKSGHDTESVSSKNEGVVNLPIALAILKLYKLLPETTSKLLYPGIIGKLCVGLKSKEYEIRESTRDTLIKVMETLGYRFFPFVLQDMRNILKSGYQKHVLSYTLHALLLALSKTVEPGVLDSQYGMLMNILIEDIFGEPSIQREVKSIQDSYPEAKSTKSFDTIRILATLVHHSNINSLIKPVDEIITASNSPKLLPNLQEIIKKISKGLRNNASLDFKNLCINVYQFITKGLREKELNIPNADRNKLVYIEENSRAMKPTFEETFTVQADPKKAKNLPIKQWETHSFIFCELGFSLLISAMKMKNDTDLAEFLSMIDPFVGYVSKCLEHKQSRVVYLSLKCLMKIFSLELPSLKTMAPSLTGQVLRRLQLDTGNERISNSCFEMATVLLRDPKNNYVNEAQLKGILSITRQHIMANSEQNITRSLSMLHVLVNRKILITEIYDLIDLACAMMIRSHRPNIQAFISTILIDFLLFYPMGEARLKQQITFLLKNLTYEFEDGRLIVLKTLSQIINRFPQEVLNQYAQVIYVPLVARLSNDSSKQCRELVGQNIGQLIKGVSVQITEKIYQITYLWFENGEKNAAMARTSATILGIFAENMNGFEQHIPAITTLSIKYLDQCIKALREKEASYDIIEEVSDENAANSSQLLPGWQLSYAIFTAFEKIVSSHSKIATHKSMIPFWKLSIDFLNYPHIWVRSSVTRVFGIFFTSQSIVSLLPIVEKLYTTNAKSNNNSSTVISLIFNQSSLFDITKKHCTILNSKLLTDELGLQIIKNLIFLSMLFYKCKSITPPPISSTTQDDITPNIFITSDSKTSTPKKSIKQQKEQEEDIDMEENQDGDEQDDEQQDDEQEQEEEDLIINNEKKQETSMLLWLFKRLSYMSTKVGLLRRKYIFRWIAAISTQLESIELKPFLSIILVPLIKTTDEKVHATAVERKLAQEVIEIVKKKVGTTHFTSVYQSIVQATNAIRDKRKQDKKIEAVTNPKEFLMKKKEKKLIDQERKKRKTKESFNEFTEHRKKIRVDQSILKDIDDEEDQF
ncbi:hypothetical protein CYY_009373 [Polysphondylium violaceum]|uniref:HEAT repeat-containing protein n=1 Tax=Polysphondylium violaceum TaxID=133409 RepID=A0A8J4PLS1_9MYCE|nr:hypothetical protein CYY_009373 [Polysphondylium violaceum]